MPEGEIKLEPVLLPCQYCGRPCTFFVNSAPLYGGRKNYGPMYACLKCDARVGVHPGTYTPLGTVANQRDRDARMAAHAAFDPIWRVGPRRGRGKRRRWAYAWLSTALDIPMEYCHIGLFNSDMCRQVAQARDRVGDNVQSIYDPPAPIKAEMIRRINSLEPKS